MVNESGKWSFPWANVVIGLMLLIGCAATTHSLHQRFFPVSLVERAEERSALVCTPEGNGPFAAVIFNHGSVVDGWGWPGAIQKGYRLDRVCEKLAGEGYFVFSPIREKYPRGKGFTSYEDTYCEIVCQAIDHVKSLPEVDSTRVALVGFSMGGLVSFKVAIERRGLRAVALLAPAFGRGRLAETASEIGGLNSPLLVMVEEGDSPQILQGVGIIEDAAHAHGKPLRLVKYKSGGGHKLFYDIDYWWEDLAAFLHAHLDKG